MYTISRLSKLFIKPFFRKMNRDVCSYISCKEVGATSVNLFIFSSLKNKLVCKGIYFDISRIPKKHFNEVKEYNFISNFMPFLFFHTYANEADKLTSNYLKCRYSDYSNNIDLDNLSFKEFQNLNKEYHQKSAEFSSFLESFQSEAYSIQESTLLGELYLNTLKDNCSSIEVSKLNLSLLEANNLKTKLKTKQDLSKYFHQYVGVPLISNKRVFGVMRFIFDDTEDLTIESLSKIKELANLISINYVNYYYYEGFRSLAFKSSKSFLDNTENTKSYIKEQVDELCKMISSRGVIARLQNNESGIFEMAACTKSMKQYCNWSRKELVFLSKEITSKFDDSNNYGVIINNSKNNRFHVLEYVSFDKNEVIVSSENKWEIVDPMEIRAFEKLSEMEIENIAIIKIPLIQGYFIFFNTQFRKFNSIDIEMAYLAIKRIGFEMKLHNNSQELATKKRSQVMQNMLHQVIAPLNSLNHHSSNIRRGIYGDEKNLNKKLLYISLLSKMASKHARGFQQMLDLEEGKVILNKSLISNLNLFLIGRAINMQPLAKSRDLTIHVVDNENLYDHLFSFDVPLIDHVFFILLDNAIKYSYGKHELTRKGVIFDPRELENKYNIVVSSKINDGFIIISVRNFGVEIDQNEMEEIFNRNYRTQRAQRYTPNGSGLGLYIAKKILDLHGGAIVLENSLDENLNNFKIILPHE